MMCPVGMRSDSLCSAVFIMGHPQILGYGHFQSPDHFCDGTNNLKPDLLVEIAYLVLF